MNFSLDKVFEQLTIENCMRFFVAEVLRYGASAAVNNLVAIRIISQQVHCICYDNWFRFLIPMSSGIYCWMYEPVEALSWSVLNEALYLRTNKAQFKIKWKQRSDESTVLYC